MRQAYHLNHFTGEEIKAEYTGQKLDPKAVPYRANTAAEPVAFQVQSLSWGKGNAIWFHESIFVMKMNLFSADTEVLFCALFIYFY